MTAGGDFDAFYRDTHPRLWSFLVRATGEADLAEDVAQEAFVRLLGSRGAELAVAERRAYLFRIARNLVRAAVALARLRGRDRELLWLAYVEGWKHEEIAAAVGIVTGSVRVLLHRARKRFKDLLGSEETA